MWSVRVNVERFDKGLPLFLGLSEHRFSDDVCQVEMGERRRTCTIQFGPELLPGGEQSSITARYGNQPSRSLHSGWVRKSNVFQDICPGEELERGASRCARCWNVRNPPWPVFGARTIFPTTSRPSSDTASLLRRFSGFAALDLSFRRVRVVIVQIVTAQRSDITLVL